MTEIPISPVIRIIRKTGAERVGNEAGEALADLMEAVWPENCEGSAETCIPCRPEDNYGAGYQDGR